MSNTGSSTFSVTFLAVFCRSVQHIGESSPASEGPVKGQLVLTPWRSRVHAHARHASQELLPAHILTRTLSTRLMCKAIVQVVKQDQTRVRREGLEMPWGRDLR